MKSHDSVAKPAEPRPIGGGDRRALRDCDPVEVAAGSLRYLRYIADIALNAAVDVNTHLIRLGVDGVSTPDDDVRARSAAHYVCDSLGSLIDALDVLIPERES